MRRIDHFGLFGVHRDKLLKADECAKSAILSGREPFLEMQLYAAAALHFRYNLFRYRQTGAVYSH
jgi:hypothetical protein